MRNIAVDLFVGVAGLALFAFILHNGDGAFKTFFDIFGKGTQDIRS